MSVRALALLSAVAIATAVGVWCGGPRIGRVTDACAADPLSSDCSLVFVEQTDAAFRQLAHLVFRVTYPKDALDFGQDPVACAAHELQQGVTATFTNDPSTGVLEASLTRANGLFPYPLVVCTPRRTGAAQSAALGIEVVEATDAGGQSLDPPAEVGIETFECSTTTTTVDGTTSTTTVETTTTVPFDGACGDADNNGSITASDALLALRTAVKVADCPVLRCDTNADGSITTSDALRILHQAVGIDELLTCPS